MAHFLTVVNVSGNPVRILACKPAEHILIFLLASAKHNELYALFAHSFHHVCNKVKALLICQTANNAYHETIVVLRKTKLSLNCSLVVYLLLKHIVIIVSYNNVLVCVRVVINVVDTIYDTTKIVSPCPHKYVKTLAVELSLYLLCVCVADSCDSVSINKSALEHISVNASPQLVDSEVVVRQTGYPLELLNSVISLEFQIVYSHNGLYAAEEISPCKAVMKIYRYKTRLPVVTVYNIRTEIKKRQSRKHSSVKVHELFYIPVMLSVRLVTGEIMFIVDKIERNAIINAFKHAHILALTCKVHVEMRFVLHHVFPLLFHAGILRKNYSDIIIPLVKALRQRANNVSKTACLDNRNTLRRSEQNFFHIQVILSNLIS